MILFRADLCLYLTCVIVRHCEMSRYQTVGNVKVGEYENKVELKSTVKIKERGGSNTNIPDSQVFKCIDLW